MQHPSRCGMHPLSAPPHPLRARNQPHPPHVRTWLVQRAAARLADERLAVHLHHAREHLGAPQVRRDGRDAVAVVARLHHLQLQQRRLGLVLQHAGLQHVGLSCGSCGGDWGGGGRHGWSARRTACTGSGTAQHCAGRWRQGGCTCHGSAIAAVGCTDGSAPWRPPPRLA
jgi:hypothetical protein